VTYTGPVLLRDTDQMSMSQSLELRVPFLDYELIEYVLQIPDAIKYPNSPKQLLVESLRPLLPDAIVNRPKMGFSFPWEIWLKNELRAFCESRLQRLAQRELFNGPVLLCFWRQFLQGDSRITWNQIWLLVVLEEWLNTNEFN
jgi:asparagine synthase (glutamine-hydrolysing)